MASTTVVAGAGDAGAMPDGAVVERVLAGETALFEILMRRYNQRLYRAIRGVLRGDVEAEDAMQQAWLLAYAHLADFAGESSFPTWLTRIAINEALGCLRRRERMQPTDDIADDAEVLMQTPPESPESRAAARESIRLFEAAVDRLAPAYRSVLMLREVEQLSVAETAECLGISTDAVKVRVHRARAALRQVIADDAGRSGPEAFAFLAPRCDRLVAAVLARIGRPG